MNLPTRLTVLRLILSAVVIGLLTFPFYALGIHFPRFNVSGIVIYSQYIVAGVIFIIASITDFFDGYLARKYDMVTDTGKMLDAIADKVLVNSVLIILASDIVVNAIKMEAASKGKVVAAIKSGKFKTATLMVGTVLTFFYNMPFEFINLRVNEFLLYIACILSIVSAIEYFNLNKNLIFKKDKTETLI